MARRNGSMVTEFILMGLTECPELQVPLFTMFLAIYVSTLLGNFGMIIVIWVNPQLHTPMYFFLINLSFIDVCYSSVITPKMLVSLLTERNVISPNGCAAQMFFSVALGTTECFLLAAMAYDRYVAICNPLLYMLIMSPRLCGFLVAGSYIGGILHSTIHTTSTFSLSFCSSNVINHFFCDIPPLLTLSCSDTQVSEILLFNVVGFIVAITFLAILVSYVCILTTVLKIRSSRGKQKAFSTCTSHLACVIILYGTLTFMYLRPSSSYSPNKDKVIAVFYTVAIPVLNPLIYSLRNREVVDGLRRVMKTIFSHKCAY